MDARCAGGCAWLVVVVVVVVVEDEECGRQADREPGGAAWS